MNRRNLFIGMVVAGMLALPLIAAAEESSSASAAKPAESAMSSQPATTAHTTEAKPASSTSHSSTKSAPKVDLNSATREELIKLPGIGEATADKIIAARPFKSKSELTSKGIVTKKEYEAIAAKVIAHQEAAAKPAATK
jgi:competence protein ComEA